MKRILVERARLAVVLDKCVSRLNHEHDILLGRNVKASVINVRNVKSL